MIHRESNVRPWAITLAGFPATIRLARSSIAIDGKDVPLAPGMAATIEIKTGQCRAIDYAPSPLRPSIEETMAAPFPSTARRYAHSGFFP